MNETLEEAVGVFAREMVAKFYLRDDRQGERSVTRVGNRLLTERGVHKGLLLHLDDEVQELKDAIDLSEERKESVDVANMAFLLWWRAIAVDREIRREGRVMDGR